jgi:hypothetical protein
MPRFGPLDGLLQLALQALACGGALWCAGARGAGLLLRWLGLTLACFCSAFVLHIAAFAALDHALPGEAQHALRRVIVAVVWTLTCAGVAALLGRRWQRGNLAATPGSLALWCGGWSAFMYAVFVGIEALLGK